MASKSPDPLLDGLFRGDDCAFVQVVDRFGEKMFRTALILLGRREDAEDVVQEVFVALVRSRDCLLEVDDLAAYLFASLRHASARFAAMRARNPNPADCSDFSMPQKSPLEMAAHHELEVGVEEALKKLPPEQREIVTYRLAGELTFTQIAQSFNTNIQTVASRYRYALEKLRTLLKEHQ